MATYSETFTGKDGTIFTIRSLQPEEAEKLVLFMNAIGTETTFTNRVPGRLNENERKRKAIEVMNASPNEVMLGAFLKEELLGLLSLRKAFSKDHPFFLHIHDFGIMILKKAWGKGIGSRFVKILDEFAAKWSIKRIEGLVRVENTRAISLYQKHGYQIEGTRRKAAFIDGKFVDEYYISKLF